MAGFRTPDDVIYLADCLSSRETLDKWQIGSERPIPATFAASQTSMKANVHIYLYGRCKTCHAEEKMKIFYKPAEILFGIIDIAKEVILDLAKEVTGRRELPGFSPNVIFNEEITCCLCPLHMEEIPHEN